MTPTTSAGNTRVDLRVTRAPATPEETARAELRREAAGWVAKLKHRTDPGACLVVSMCRALDGALRDLSERERERDEAVRARRFADARVVFMELGAIEQQAAITRRQTAIDEQNATIANLRESVRLLSAESFKEDTRVENFDDVLTGVRSSSVEIKG